MLSLIYQELSLACFLSDFIMKFRIKDKTRYDKRNFLLCRNQKGPPQREPGETEKN